MENDAKMHPKWEPKSIKNLKNTGKNGIRKLMPKFDAKKKSKRFANRTFSSISVAYGNIPAPGRDKTGTKNKVPGIVLKDFDERASKEKKSEFQ